MKRNVIILALLVFAGTSCFYDDEVPSDQNVWPAEMPSTLGMDEEILLVMDSTISAQPNQGITSVVIIKEGHLVFEKYYFGNDRSSLFGLGGVSSALTNVALGRAIDMGLITSVEDSIFKYLPAYSQDFENSPLKKNITFEDLMIMKSGLSWNEFSGGFDGQLNDIDKLEQSSDWVAYILSKPLDAFPGVRYSHNSATGLLIAAAIENKYGDSFKNFLTNEAFGAIDVNNINIATSGDNSNAAWGISLTTLDLAKVGYLYLNKGDWFGSQIIDKEYVETSTSVQTNIDFSNDFGWLWWRYADNNFFLSFLEENDTFFASGISNERLYVVPHLEMVVAITGTVEDENFALRAPIVFRDFILGSLQ